MEIGHRLGKRGGDLVAKWRRGLPVARQRDLEGLAQALTVLARNARLPQAEFQRELHDTVQQEMGALPYLLESIQAEVRNATPAQQLFDECYRRVGRVSLELHNLRHDISPPELWSGDHTQALRELMLRKLAGQGIGCAFEGSLPAGLDRARAAALYRICQQAFDNIVQHARARQVRVTAWGAAGEEAGVRIEYDGCGFDVAALPGLAQNGHAGVPGMRERAEALGGELRLSSQPGQGTVLQVRLPLAGAELVRSDSCPE